MGMEPAGGWAWSPPVDGHGTRRWMGMDPPVDGHGPAGGWAWTRRWMGMEPVGGWAWTRRLNPDTPLHKSILQTVRSGPAVEARSVPGRLEQPQAAQREQPLTDPDVERRHASEPGLWTHSHRGGLMGHCYVYFAFAQTLLTGTVRANSKGLPPIPTKMNIGESQNFRKNEMLSYAYWENKSQCKPVLLLSTSEAAGMTQVRTGAGIIKRKPRCIVAYNRYMGGVDISDRKIYHVSAERPSKRYWKKIFFNLLDMALLNAYELYRLNTDAAECKKSPGFPCYGG